MSADITFTSGATAHLGGSAQATYGSFGAYTEYATNMVAADLGQAPESWVVGKANMTEIFLIEFAPFTGMMGFMKVTYTLDGVISESGIANSEAKVWAAVGSAELTWDRQFRIHETSTSDKYSFQRLFPFVYGQPFNYAFGLEVISGKAHFNPSNGVVINDWHLFGEGVGSANFANTLTVGSFTIYDESLNVVQGASLTADSGTIYPVNVVPEPSLRVPLAALLGGCCLFRLRRQVCAHFERQVTRLGC